MGIKKKILAAFDGSGNPGPVLDFAISLCRGRGNGNQLTGIFIEDLSYIYMLTNIGAEAQAYQYPAELMDDIEKEDMKAIDNSISIFKNKCTEAGINFNVHLDKGVPAGELINESNFADLLLIGYHTFFSNLEGAGNETVKDFLEGAHCPVWIAPQQNNNIEEIIFTYNAQESSAWAIKQFILLFGEEYKNKKTTLLTVKASPGEGEEEKENQTLILDYLRLNYPDINHEIRIGHAADVIPQYAENTPGCMLVMGAYGRGFISRLFRKSAAEKIIEAGTVPVFIAHR